tara:strand:+ start:273 stop:416 length:144 start_codon:yes stop_codon:yes gene_type:complete
MKTLYKNLYKFYLENCIDGNEIPLNFDEWKSEHGEEEKRKIVLNNFY